MGASTDGGQAQAYIFLPQQASPPIPASGTVDAASIYCDAVLGLMQSTDGAAYAALGGGGGVTLDASYQNGPAGNTILMTDALGAVNFSSEITSGSIVGIATTNAPGTLTASVAGLKIDMRSVGTAATPSTFDIPAIIIEGAYSSVAKAAGSALVAIRSGYRNATALSVRVRNKQAVAGSVVSFGWDATNYEGAAAASILTGQTHVLTIDGQTNVDAATNNVEFMGARILVPSTTSAATRGLTVSSLQRGTGSAVVEAIALPGGTASVNVLRLSGGANVQAISGSTGLLLYGTQDGAAGRGFKIETGSFAGAFSGGNLLAVYRSGTWSGGGTESINLAEIVRDASITATATLSGTTFAVNSAPTNTTGTLTYSATDVLFTRAPARSSGTVNLSGSVLGLTHAPTGTIGTDTTSLLTGTTISKSGTVASFTSTSALTGALTMLSLTASGATAGAQAITGLNVTLPSSSGTYRGVSVTTVGGSSDVATSAGIYILSGAQRNGASALRIDAAPTSGASTFGPKALWIQTTNNNWVDGNFCEITNSSTGVNAAWNLLALTVNPAGMTANAQMRCLATSYAPTFTSGTFSIGTLCCYLNCAPTWNSAGTGSSSGTVVGIGNAPVRSAGTLNLADTLLSVSHAPSGTIGTDTTKLISGTTISKSGTVLDFSTTGTLTGTLNYLSIDASGATAGAQIIAGAYIKLPASSSASTSGVWVSTVSTAGRFFNGDFTASTTLSGTFVGCEIDCSTNVAAGTTQAILGARFRISNSSSVSTVGVQVDTTQTASTSAAVKLNLTPASGAPSGVIVSMGASVAKTGLTDGSAFLATLVGAASCGLCINASVSTSAFGQNAIQARREMTTSTGMTDSTTFVELINTSTYNGGTTTISQSNVLSAMLATIAGATWTWSGNLLYVQSAPTRSSGTVTLSGKLANLTHAPTGTISADTTTGLYVSMTTTGAAVGAQITMSAGTTGPALSITHSGTGSNQNQLVFTAAVDGTGAHIYGPTTAQFNIFAGTAAQASGTTAGRDLVLQASSAVAGSSSAGAAAGGSVYIRAKDAARLTSGNANGGDVSINPGAGIGTGVAGGFLVGSTNATFMELYAMTAPAVGAASTGRLFVVDNGAGKMQLAVQFPSGAAQVLATEP